MWIYNTLVNRFQSITLTFASMCKRIMRLIELLFKVTQKHNLLACCLYFNAMQNLFPAVIFFVLKHVISISRLSVFNNWSCLTPIAPTFILHCDVWTLWIGKSACLQRVVPSEMWSRLPHVRFAWILKYH